MADDSPHKRKRSIEDDGPREPSMVHHGGDGETADSRLTVAAKPDDSVHKRKQSFEEDSPNKRRRSSEDNGPLTDVSSPGDSLNKRKQSIEQDGPCAHKRKHPGEEGEFINGGLTDTSKPHESLDKKKQSFEDDSPNGRTWSSEGVGPLTDDNVPNDSLKKRKRTWEDDGPLVHKREHSGDEGDGVHGPIQPKPTKQATTSYLLCQTPHPAALPKMSDDLFEMFNLTDLAAKVAREKPNGEKNALRKTYKGHMKRLGVAGHFDVVKKPEDTLSDFMAMLQVPDMEWDIHHVKGQEITNGLSETTIANLGRAMTLSKGPIPKAVWDTSVLGDLTATTGGDVAKSNKPTTPGTPLATTPGATNRLMKPNSTAPSQGDDPQRPKRSIKKRSYGDASFDGYGEGYVDDDGGYSTGEGEGGRKRRKGVGSNGPVAVLCHP